MSNFVFYVDSTCDIPEKTLNSWGVKSLALTFRFDDSEQEYYDGALSSKEFYDMMRSGKCAKTSALNMEHFKDAFRPELENGLDILYLSFSSGLSTTYNSARLAAEELSSEFPDRKILVVDSLCASAGFGLLVYLGVKQIKSGADIDSVAEYLKDYCLSVCHWFTVDDLTYLKRGGRVSPAVAFLGGMLGIKPVLHVDDEGHLISVSKSRGRKAAIQALADKYSEFALNHSDGPIFISHADCLDDAKELASIVQKKHGVSTEMIVDIGSVIGSHAGPGTLAFFFVGKKR